MSKEKSPLKKIGRLPNLPNAACKKNVNPELFFPIGETSPSARAQIKEAKAICESCEDRKECLIFALKNSEVQGIWGGTTDEERRARRAKQIK